MIVIYYIMQNSIDWKNWMIVNLLVGIVQFEVNDVVDILCVAKNNTL